MDVKQPKFHQKGVRSFRFESFWEKEERCIGEIERAWRAGSWGGGGAGVKRLVRCLDSVRMGLKK